MPTTLTDIFIGTYIWISDPIKITEMNGRQIMSQAYLAFQPSTEILEKLSNTVTKLLDSKQIDSDLCYAIRGSNLVSERIMQKTLGDPEAFTDSTPLEIIQEIRDEAVASERDKSKTQMENKQKEMEKEKAEIIKSYEKKEYEHKNEIMKLLNKSLQDDRRKYNDLSALMENAKKTRDRVKKILEIISVLLCIMILGGLVTGFFFHEEDWYSPLISTLCTIIPIISALIMLLISFKNGKKWNIIDLCNVLLESTEKRKLSKLGFSETEYDRLENNMKVTKEKIAKLEGKQ